MVAERAGTRADAEAVIAGASTSAGGGDATGTSEASGAVDCTPPSAETLTGVAATELTDPDARSFVADTVTAEFTRPTSTPTMRRVSVNRTLIRVPLVVAATTVQPD